MGIEISKGKNKINFGITELPNRKNKILYLMQNENKLIPLAYFTSSKNADLFEELLNKMVQMLNNSNQF